MKTIALALILTVGCEAAVPTVAGYFTIASAVDSMIGEPAVKAIKKGVAKVKAKFHHRRLPSCLDVQGAAPCAVKGKH